MITVVGMDGSPLSPQAEAALASATLVVGARRHLAALPAPAAAHAGSGAGGGPAAAGAIRPGVRTIVPGVRTIVPGVRTIVLGELVPALDAVAAHDGDAVVLASGDPGFFGIVRALRQRGLAVVVLPAVSSVALAFARAGLPWDDAAVVSAHGRDLRPAVNVCRAYPKVAVLTGPGAGPAEIGAALAGWDRRLVVCEHLGSGAERITECSPAAADRPWADPNVVLVLAGRSLFQVQAARPPAATASPAPATASHATTSHAPATASHAPATTSHAPAATFVSPDPATPRPVPAPPAWLWTCRPPMGSRLTFMRSDEAPIMAGGGWALGEDQFDSRDAVITKAEVRALALARLAPAPGLLIWDVGAGSGSVGVECARFGAAVIAVERDDVRCQRVRANAERHAVDVRVVAGAAPKALDGLPTPDAVFVGGGGPAVIDAVAVRRPARIVVALAAIERAGTAVRVLDSAGYTVDGVLLQAARLAPLPGDVHRLAATNPVFLLWATGQDPASPPEGQATDSAVPGLGATS